MTTTYLSLGSNLGARLGHLAEAVRRLNDLPGVRVAGVSNIYETAPQGFTEQPAFLNLAVAVETNLEPLGLLAHIQEVERAMGRVRTLRWGPRTIDIDILLFGREQIRTEALEVPHPRMGERAFVLVPLLDLHPPDEDTWRRALDALPDQGVSLHLAGDSFLGLTGGVQ